MVGPAPAFSAHYRGQVGIGTTYSKLRTLNLVQNTNFNFSPSRNEVPQVGGFGLTARKVSHDANATLGFSYILSDGKNEDMLGFCISGQNSAFLSGTHEKDKDRNFFIAISEKQETDIYLKIF